MHRKGIDGGQKGTVAVDIYLMSDQPTVCPKCGARTEFEAIPQEDEFLVEYHTCLNCGYKFYFEEE